MAATLSMDLRDMIYRHLFSCEDDTVCLDSGDFDCNCPTSDDEDSDYVDDSEASKASNPHTFSDEEMEGKDNNACDDETVSDDDVDYEYGLFNDSEETIDNEGPGADGKMSQVVVCEAIAIMAMAEKTFTILVSSMQNL
jgi:hypothetical protein